MQTQLPAVKAYRCQQITLLNDILMVGKSRNVKLLRKSQEWMHFANNLFYEKSFAISSGTVLKAALSIGQQ